MPDEIRVENPTTPDVTALLTRHHAWATEQSPREAVHALDIDGLLRPGITLYGLRRDGVLLGVGALKQLGDRQLEVKSMHVAAEARGQGIGTLILDQLLDLARAQGATTISLETGSNEAFVPARTMYEAAGFTYCGPFGDYPDHPFSAFMTLVLTDP
ncbi:GNAT family N-acetyltransferase [Acidothermaceae bacterium B102]|nr:GNAT family N-acetyltransferase [Acidothermaceae bacterium B102]